MDTLEAALAVLLAPRAVHPLPRYAVDKPSTNLDRVNAFTRHAAFAADNRNDVCRRADGRTAASTSAERIDG